MKKIEKKGDLLQIGITGGIGTGKSTACKVFETLGIAVYDADTRAKAVMQKDNILIQALKNAFGTKVYDEKGILNRTYLAEQIFHDKEKVKLLNAIVHPAVGRDYQHWAEAHQHQSHYLLKEAALMFESGSYLLLDAVIVVTAPLEERIERILARDPHRNETQIKAIIDKQMPEEDKIKKADFVIHNDHSHSLIKQVMELHKHFLKFV